VIQLWKYECGCPKFRRDTVTLIVTPFSRTSTGGLQFVVTKSWGLGLSHLSVTAQNHEE
jgi:hypothetical protein